ncbi:NAD(P)/FAD-dependent oxidoreductase [Porticoccaceae bacterium]|nr:NAD(P)/FAD-dependent oxidoreductase [Porticoccaceae bacterium]
MSVTKPYDALIIGGGHNGLVCAYYLARTGMRIKICERRSIVGGAAVTEEFHPGFRNSVASYTVSLLNPDVIKEMRLAEHGLDILKRPIANFMPLDDGRYLKLGGGLERTQEEFRKFSQHDAERLPEYYERIEAVADVLRDISTKTPPNPKRGIRAALQTALQLWPVARGSNQLHQDLLDLFTKSARSFLDGWFESEPVKAIFGFDAIVGNFASPDTPGSAYVLLHHVFGEVNGEKGAWGHAVGGMGAITQAMRRACEAEGVEIVTDASVAQVIVDDGRAIGVVLENGDRVAAKRVISNVNPKLLYGKMIAASELEPEFKRRMDAYKCGSGTFRMNVALSELPDFTALPGTEQAEHHQCGIIIAPSLDYMDRAYLDAKIHGWSKQPIVEMLIPSTLDDSLAPPGEHVASLFCQQFSPQLSDGRSWHDYRDAAAQTIIDTVTAYAPNFREAIVGQMILSPLDLEEKLGLVGGDIMHGVMTLDQMWAARPVMNHGDYRGPLKGLYMCGAGAHPGGGVTGLPGRNAAREVLKDK